jgi:hypothetical protein
MRSDGTGAHALGCPNRFDFGAGATGTGDFDPGTELFISGLAGFRTFDGTLPAVAFLHITVGSTSSTWTHQLLLGTDQTDCTGRPALRIDMAPALGDGDWQFYYPRFSPDGKRIVVLALGNTTSATKEKIVTVGVDGGGMRTVRNFPTSNDRITAPAWIDNSTVAWVEIVGSGTPAEFKVVKAADADKAGDTAASTVVDCPAGTPFAALNQVEFADSSTMIFAASTIAQTSGQAGLTALFRVSAGTCSAANRLSMEATAGHFSGDFSLSPDGKTVVYASTSGSAAATMPGTQLTDIFTVPVDGSAAPARIAGDATLPDMSPHFIAGGKQIVWTQFSKPPIVGSNVQLPAAASLMMANADGTGSRMLLGGTNTPGEFHYVFAGGSLGNSCAIGGGTASAGAFAVLAFAVALGLLRRRRA